MKALASLKLSLSLQKPFETRVIAVFFIWGKKPKVLKKQGTFQGHSASRVWSLGMGLHLIDSNHYSFPSSHTTTDGGYLNHILVISVGEM